MKRSVLGISMAVVGGLVLGMGAAWAQDPLELAPDIYTKAFENDRVRVLDLQIQPGEHIPMHSHPDHFAYVLEGGTLQLSYAEAPSKEIAAQPGQVLWIPAESHSTVNVGTTLVRALVVELK